MRERIRFLLLYFLFWVVFFVIARILFLSYHIDYAKLLTLETVYGIFKHGIKMDLSTAAYFSFIPFLWVTFSNYINKSFFQWAIFTYTFFLLIVTSLITIVDLEVFNIWNFRINVAPLKYLTSPKEAFLTVRHSPVLKLFVTFSILMVVAGWIVYRMVSNKIYDWKHIKAFPFIIYGLLLTAALVVPIRGGFSKDQLKLRSVYFSNDNFANISALNAPWSLGYSILRKVNANINPYNYFPKDGLESKLALLFKKSENTEQVIQSRGGYPNILLIMVENLSDEVLDKTHNGQLVSPYLNYLKDNSIYFSEFYATGSRSDKTFASILSGFPSQPEISVLDYSKKIVNLPFLSRDLNEIGYSTDFYYGGDAAFLGLKEYLFTANLEKILERKDFADSELLIRLGAPDDVVYNRYIADHKQVTTKPFFSTILTLSGHEPFEVPGDGLISEPQNSTELYYNSIHYADKSLEEFILEAEKQEWWGNTLVIILGNHGYNLSKSGNNLSLYKIPMFWTGGAVINNRVINQPFSQTDLVASILGQLHLSYSHYEWSKNMFDASTSPWGFLTFHSGFGYINQESKFLFDSIGQNIYSEDGVEVSPTNIESGKALQQKSYQNFLDL